MVKLEAMAERGRPTLFTEEVRRKIIKAVRAGNYSYVAAAAAGINRRTFEMWMRQGRKEKEGEYANFFRMVTEAENHAEQEAVAGIRKAADIDPKQWQFWLERKCPERWGRDTYQIKKMQQEIDKINAELKYAISTIAQRNKKGK